MLEDGKIFIGTSFAADKGGKTGARVKGEYLDLKLANRHGLVTGATGTGKTVTLQVLAEGFSEAGVAVFASDIKGDLSGIAAKGEPKDFLVKRAEEVGLAPYVNDKFPVVFWDMFGEQGHPIRATVSEMGPLLLARLMNLNDTQEGVLNIVFRVADKEGLLLLDLKDLQALLVYVAENAAELTTQYGNVAKATVGAVQRQLLVLEQQGGDRFFGEPALALTDLIRTGPGGRGVVNILAADKLMSSPRLYATFLLWLLSELFEELPEVGDPDKPKLVFFFDEAHLLFDEAPKALLEKVEQVVRLIRSKGVGVYFVTQNPIDVPEKVSAQLGNRVMHALRAFTPREQKAIRGAVETFRDNPDLNEAEELIKLATGEALVSTLEGKGSPSIVMKTKIRPPAAQIGPISQEERKQLMQNSPMAGHYDTTIDRVSAYEMLTKKAEDKAVVVADAGGGDGIGGFFKTIFGGSSSDRKGTLNPGQRVAREVTRTIVNRTAGDVAASIGKSVAGSVGSSVGRAVVRGVLGSLMRR